MSTEVKGHPLTMQYKLASDSPLLVDIWFPPESETFPSNLNSRTISAVVYFHGGEFTVGDRRSWFPVWLKERLHPRHIALIIPDHRLIPPSTGHDVLRDIQDLFDFLRHRLNPFFSDGPQNSHFQLDTQSIAVAGTSAGGLCAYLAAMHVSPPPKAVLSMYGMGGNFFTPHYLIPKTTPFFRGREILDPDEFSQFLFPDCASHAVTSTSPLVYHPATSSTPGYPANSRMQLARLYLQLGNFLDYWTGEHEPSLSRILRGNLVHGDRGDPEQANAELCSLVPHEHRRLFPQLWVNDGPKWPPTLIVHGAADTAVHVSESRELCDLLRANGTDATLKIVEEAEHSFDYVKDAEEVYGTLFDGVVQFVAGKTTETRET